jgi:Domain of unknown function (DUF1735)
MKKMKTMKNKIIVIVAFLATTLFISSCLKDNVNIDWSGVTGKAYAQFTFNGKQFHTINTIAADQTLQTIVNVAVANPFNTDITVNCVIDTTVMHAQSLIDGVWYQLYPGAVLADPAVVVKAGGNVGYANVTLPRGDTVNLSTPWMIPLTITSASNGVVVAANMNTTAVSIAVANDYDGMYHAFGLRWHPSLGLGSVDQNQLFSTRGPFTNELGTALDLGVAVDVTITTTTLTLGNGHVVNYCLVNVPARPGNNKQLDTYTDTYGVGFPGDGSPMNYYDPATKTYELYYMYNFAAPRILRETLVFLHH